MPKNKKSTVKSFDLLSDDSYVDQVKETMMTLAAKKKRYSGVTNYDNVAKSHMEFLDNIYFHHRLSYTLGTFSFLYQSFRIPL